MAASTCEEYLRHGNPILQWYERAISTRQSVFRLSDDEGAIWAAVGARYVTTDPLHPSPGACSFIFQMPPENTKRSIAAYRI